MPKRSAPVTNLANLPVILTLDEMAALFRVSPLTIRRGLSMNTFRPLPFKKYPYRWQRSDVLRELDRPQPKLPTRRHGFAATKARRQAKAELEAGTPPADRRKLG